jgi:excisionase family DNA binding protein
MPKRPPEPESALFVRLPASTADKLDRAAEALGVAKKELVAGLVTKYVDPDSRKGLTALGTLTQPRRVTIDLGDGTPTMGAYSFQPHQPPEVMNVEQAAVLLQVDDKIVLELAEAGELPGRKLGSSWRFSREAVLAWLAGNVEQDRSKKRDR